MAYLEIRGGKPLQGKVAVRGAKNAVPKVLVAALLTEDRCTLRSVAEVADVDLATEMIEALGGETSAPAEGVREVVAANLRPMEVERLRTFVGKSRIPILLCGPLLARLGEAVVPKLGGCEIGPRPVDFHLTALEQLGATVEEEADVYRIRARRLRGAKIALDYPSVGATEQVLLSAVFAEGVTELRGAALEPEIIDLIAVLQKMGAIISVEPDREITIQGVERLRGFDHVAIPDRLEVASWACAAVATGGRIRVENARQLDLMTFLNCFRQIGGEFDVTESGIEFWRAGEGLRSVALETDVHPGFMTDWQQPFVVALTQAEGVSIMHETVYENRFGYVEALNRMGAQIQLYQACLGSRRCRFGRRNFEHSAVIVGPTRLKGATIHVPDLRGGISYVIAALAAEGTTRIENFELLHRGYARLLSKLRDLGAEVGESTVERG